MLKCGREKATMIKYLFMKGLLYAESLNLDLVKIQVTPAAGISKHVRVAISRPFVSLRLFFGGGTRSKKYLIFFVSE